MCVITISVPCITDFTDGGKYSENSVCVFIPVFATCLALCVAIFPSILVYKPGHKKNKLVKRKFIFIVQEGNQLLLLVHTILFEKRLWFRYFMLWTKSHWAIGLFLGKQNSVSFGASAYLLKYQSQTTVYFRSTLALPKWSHCMNKQIYR